MPYEIVYAANTLPLSKTISLSSIMHHDFDPQVRVTTSWHEPRDLTATHAPAIIAAVKRLSNTSNGEYRLPMDIARSIFIAIACHPTFASPKPIHNPHYPALFDPQQAKSRPDYVKSGQASQNHSLKSRLCVMARLPQASTRAIHRSNHPSAAHRPRRFTSNPDPEDLT
jgi:hypothetical protein